MTLTFDQNGRFASFLLVVGDSILRGLGSELQSRWRVEYTRGADITALQASLETAQSTIERLLKDGLYFDCLRAASQAKSSSKSTAS